MALEDSYGHLCKELYALQNGYGGFGCLQEEKGFLEMLDNCMENNNNNNNNNLQGNWDYCSSNYNSLMQQQQQQQKWDPTSPEEAACTGSEIVTVVVDGDHQQPMAAATATTTTAGGSSSGMIRRKRRRTRTSKNKEELENQRMTHIAVERNRRRQMNDYLAIIRSLMPASYVPRGDQASIIGGAINFVKELEQHLQTLEAQKRTTIINSLKENSNNDNGVISSIPPLFGDFFTYPQYSTMSSSHHQSDQSSDSSSSAAAAPVSNVDVIPDQKRPAAAADIEVSMADSHANLKILSKKRPRQLLKLVAGLQCLWFTILHLYVTTVDQMVLYSISVKIEEGCQLTTIDEIADAVNHLLGRIEQEAALS